MAYCKQRHYQYFVGDFETTIYPDQTYTEVWASAVVPLNSENVRIFGSISETWEYFKRLRANIVVFYHNLKFDGSFWLDFIINHTNLKQALEIPEELGMPYASWKKLADLENGEYMYTISDRGAWYSIKIKYNNKIIEFRDSLKLLPFSVKEIGKAFVTKHQKLEMEYEGLRYAGCNITDAEKEYIKNDVLVVKEAVEIMFSQGHNKITIGSCCYEEYKGVMGELFYDYFPDLSQMEIEESIYGVNNVDKYIRRSYRGGWCYLVEEKTNKEFNNGITADVNSLYPSMMHSESGNYYPVGQPCFWRGDYIPEEALKFNRYYFVTIKTRFYIKDGYLPFIQIKGNLLYPSTECLKTSDVYSRTAGKYSAFLYNSMTDEIEDTRVTLTLTCTDFELLKEHYNLIDFEILHGCWFNSEIGIFDRYIDKYKKIKLESKGAMRTLAKLFLNNLYGKMASNTNSSFKVALPDKEKNIVFLDIKENAKKAGYIAVGSAITSYARNFTIRAAQKNYYGPNKAGFIYADTDSIHCDLSPDKIKGVKVHDKDFCCWKLESSWDRAIFVRQKTYIEHVVAEDLKPIEAPYFNIKCAGLPKNCKSLLNRSFLGDSENEKDTEQAKEFIKIKRDLKDFKVGLKIPGKLVPKRIHGGVVLIETDFEIRPKY